VQYSLKAARLSVPTNPFSNAGKNPQSEYAVTSHARKEMNDEGFSIFDVEAGILTGTILERQRDRITAESKYRVKGETVVGNDIELIAKFSPTGKLVI
jgi:hypothetical protein